ncbi:MAG: hypothetical protein ABW060_16815 [Solirubrobacteraceae bacterium]
MRSRLTPRPTFANVAALLALVIALGGTAYAAVSLPRNSVGAKQLKKGAVKKSKLAKGAVTGAKVANGSLTGKQIDASTLGQVPSSARAARADNATRADRAGRADTAGSADRATNADRLGGAAPSSFFPASKVRTFNAKLAFGETQTLFSVGTLTFSAKCVENATDPGGGTAQDFSALLVATSVNGGILATGGGGGLHGTSPTDFLNTDTAEEDRAVAWVSSATGTGNGNIENNGGGWAMHAVDPNGVTVIINDGLTGAVNLFGTDCLLAGVAMIP